MSSRSPIRLRGNVYLVAINLWLCGRLILCVNSYKLSFHSDVPKDKKYVDQEKFRTAIIAERFRLGRQCRTKRKRSSSFTVFPDLDTPVESHSLTRRDYLQDCVVYKKEGIPRAQKRRVLRKLSTNVQPNQRGTGYRKSSRFGCDIYDTPLCKDSTCFYRFHNEE